MDEAEWLTSDDPAAMLHFLRSDGVDGLGRFYASNRKLRLFFCAVWRTERIAPPPPDTALMEASADDPTIRPPEYLRRYWRDPAEAASGMFTSHDCPSRAEQAALLRDVFGNPFRPAAISVPCPSCRGRGGWEDADEGQFVTHRDCNGKGTLPSPWLAWNDGTVPKMAQAIYTDRNFDLMPLLADALEDAGCTDAAILSHCRTPGEHVRGCWVVDLLLGKE